MSQTLHPANANECIPLFASVLLSNIRNFKKSANILTSLRGLVCNSSTTVVQGY